MQRTGRKGHAMFRVVVQDSRQTPTSGKVVARLGSHDPHAKTTVLDKEKAAFYLEHGAQPSDRAVRLLKAEGVKLPGWIKEPTQNKRAVRNPDKRRSTAPEKPVEEAAETPPAAEAAEAPADEAAEAPAEEAAETPPAEAADPAAAEGAEDAKEEAS
ncbi:MAG: 30S ribosomal protein S16 [Candidatus Saccharimonadales bacterium]